MFYLESKDKEFSFPLKEGLNTLGRIDGNDIVIPLSKISAKHLELIVNGNVITVSDLKSTNGTWVNDSRVQTCELRQGDVLKIASDEYMIVSRPDYRQQIMERQQHLQSYREIIHNKLLDRMDIKKLDIKKLSQEELNKNVGLRVAEIINEMQGEIGENIDPQKLAQDVLNDILGLGPLEELLKESNITEIMVNCKDRIYIEKNGRIELCAKRFTSNKQILDIIERIVSPLGRRIDESQPMVDARLKDGSRVNAIIPPLSLKGPCITIRKFPEYRMLPGDLLKYNSCDEKMISFMEIAVKNRMNILISGGTGSGKTTLLNILASFIP
ncbi:MAG: ATPase, T2SS/T4P/T4SS family, partial [bacterium]